MAPAAVPVAPFVEVTGPVLFNFAPAVAPVTVTEYVHVVPTGTVPPVSARLPAKAVSVPVQPAGLALAVSAPVSPAGYVSVNATPPSATVFAAGFCTVIVSVVVAPTATSATAKDFVTTGALTTVSTTPVAAVPVSATGPVAAGAVVAFVFVEVAVTLCVIVHVPPGTIVPALKPTLVPPFAPPVSVALPAPLHATDPAALFASVPVYVSPIDTPVRLPGLAAGFVTVMVSVDVPPAAIVAGVNVFATVGAAYTFSVALVADCTLPAFVVVIVPAASEFV